MRVRILPFQTPELGEPLEQERAWAQAVLHWKAEAARLAAPATEERSKHTRGRSH